MSAPAALAARHFGPNLAAGTLCALMTLAYAGSFATLIFGGALAPAASLGVMTALVGSCAAMLALSWLSSFHFALGGPDSNPSAILAISVAAIAGEIVPAGSGEAASLLPTVFMFLFVSSILCGLVLYLVGQLRWGRYVRYIPHPVVGGFLAGTGFLLVAGAWKMLVGHSFASSTREHLAAVPLLSWISAAGVALALTIGLRISRHFLVLPGVIGGAIGLFHLVCFALGLSPDEASAAGLLLSPLRPGEWQHVLSDPWTLVRWDLLFAHANDFAAMTMVVLITILLNATSLDFTTGRDVDFDRELKALGVANVAGGLCGGLVAVNSFNRSLLNLRAGATSPLAARLCAAIVLGVALLAPAAVSLLPRPVLTGIVLYLGLNLLLSWLWASRRDLSLGDYLTVVAILGMVIALGIVAGVALGIVIASVGFVVSLSRNSVVKQRFTAANRRSNVERTPRDLAWLEQHGPQLRGFVLQGNLFFGTASSLLEEVREVLGETKILVIDFWLVRGVDASADVILRKLLRLATERQAQVVFTGLNDDLRGRFADLEVQRETPLARMFPDLDRGLEWAEEALLCSGNSAVKLAEVLGVGRRDDQDQLGRYFTDCAVPAGVPLIHSGSASDCLYIMLSGRVSVHLALSSSSYTKRLRTYGPGTVLGEMGFFDGTPRSADVTADVDSRLARLDREGMQQLEREHPILAAQIHRFVISSLAARLRAANEELRHLI
jgi:SulP family sulfate permease